MGECVQCWIPGVLDDAITSSVANGELGVVVVNLGDGLRALIWYAINCARIGNWKAFVTAYRLALVVRVGGLV